jgi:hypothetical protein
LTNGIGIGMHHQGALVVTVHASFIDTDMAALVDARPQAARSRSPSRPSTASRPARSRYSPTSGPGSSRASLLRDHELIYPPVQFWDTALKGTQ